MKTRISLLSFLLVTALTAGCGDSQTAQQQSDSIVATPGTQVGVVVSLAEGNNTKYFQNLDAGITALASLQSSGAEVVTADFGFGIGVCAINGTGYPADNCFGKPEDPYWAYFTRKPGEGWTSPEVGADQYVVSDGEMVGWVWTNSDPRTFEPLRKPPELTLADVAD